MPMLRKVKIHLKEVEKIIQTLPLVIKIKTISELNDALAILASHPHPLKGLELSMTDAIALEKKLSMQEISYLSILVDSEPKATSWRNFFLKNRIVEIFSPAEFFKPNLVPLLKGASRIVLTVKTEDDLENVPRYFSEMISIAQFPLIKGAPFCKIPMEHSYELYDQNNTQIKSKPTACAACLFTNNCPSAQGFLPIPLIDKNKFEDALRFLHHENTAARF